MLRALLDRSLRSCSCLLESFGQEEGAKRTVVVYFCIVSCRCNTRKLTGLSSLRSKCPRLSTGAVDPAASGGEVVVVGVACLTGASAPLIDILADAARVKDESDD